MSNKSKFSDDSTARTNIESAKQRAENLSILRAKNVLELCVGPSLKTLSEQYRKYGISCTGKDIDPRWKSYYPKGRWIIGDCFQVDFSTFDAVVFAPPLSKDCSGRREDSLRIEEVTPSYRDFLNTKFSIGVLVLPARSLSTREDRSEFYHLLSEAKKVGYVSVFESLFGLRNIRKYVELYIERK